MQRVKEVIIKKMNKFKVIQIYPFLYKNFSVYRKFETVSYY